MSGRGVFVCSVGLVWSGLAWLAVLTVSVVGTSQHITPKRVLATKSQKPTHFFPLAMLTGQILPPPAKVRDRESRRRRHSLVAMRVCMCMCVCRCIDTCFDVFMMLKRRMH